MLWEYEFKNHSNCSAPSPPAPNTVRDASSSSSKAVTLLAKLLRIWLVFTRISCCFYIILASAGATSQHRAHLVADMAPLDVALEATGAKEEAFLMPAPTTTRIPE